MFVDGHARTGRLLQPGDRLLDHQGAGASACTAANCRPARERSRAGIVVTGTEVLTGRVSDRNGPWLSDRLRELGVDLAHIAIVGDRPQDMRAALQLHGRAGPGPGAHQRRPGPDGRRPDGEVVGEFQGREMVLDEALEQRIAEIVRPLMKRWPNLDVAAIETGTRKQATIPAGATVLEPVGTAPGLVVEPAEASERSDGRRAAGPAARAAADVARRRRSRARSTPR